MRIVPLSEILALDAGKEGKNITGFRAKLKKAFKQTENQAKNQIQNSVLVMDGKEIVCGFKDCPLLTAADEGKELVVIAHDGPKGMSGVKVKFDDYKEKNENILWVTASANISWDTPPAAATDTRQPAASSSAPASAPANRQAPAPSPRTPYEGYMAVKKAIAKAMNIELMCLQAMKYLEQGRASLGLPPMTPEQQTASLGRIFIEVAHGGAMGVIPMFDFTKPHPAKPADPADAGTNSDLEQASPEAIEAARKAEEAKKAAEAIEKKRLADIAEAERKRKAKEDDDVPF